MSKESEKIFADLSIVLAPLGERKTGLEDDNFVEESNDRFLRNNPEAGLGAAEDPTNDYTDFYKQAWLRNSRRVHALESEVRSLDQEIRLLRDEVYEPEFCSACSAELDGYGVVE